MFGTLSFPKILVLVAIALVVYFWSRRNAVQARGGQSNGQSGSRGNAANTGTGPAKPVNAKQKAIEDLVKCPSCGTYIASGSACGCGQGRR